MKHEKPGASFRCVHDNSIQVYLCTVVTSFLTVSVIFRKNKECTDFRMRC